MSQGKALSGLVIANTRPAPRAAPLTRALRACGAHVCACPWITFAPPARWRPFDRRLALHPHKGWIALTSPTAVEAMAQRMRTLGYAAVPPAARFAAVGEGTAAALRRWGATVDCIAETPQQEGLLQTLRAQLAPGESVWFPRAARVRSVLERGLRAAGHPVESTPVYRTGPHAPGIAAFLCALEESTLDWLILASPSALRYGWAALPATACETLRQGRPAIACFGALTARAVKRCGLPIAALAKHPTPQSCAASIVEAVRTNRFPVRATPPLGANACVLR